MNSSAKRPSVRDVRVLGLGSCVPPRVLTNHDLESIVDTSDEWIVTRTGIKERHVTDAETAASDLAFEATQRALARAELPASALDAILIASVTPDHLFPSAACIVQSRIGATNAFCMDLEAACSGFLYGVELGRGLIGSHLAEHVLVVGVECLTKLVNWKDRSTCILFGDAAGAAVLGPSDSESQIVATYLGADGNSASLIELPAGGSRIPFSAAAIEQEQQFIRMKGNEVFKLGVRGMEEACRRVLEKAQVAPEDVHLLVPHQANLRIIEATAKRLDFPMEKVFVNVHKYGNTSAASVPLALDEAIQEGRLGRGDLVLTVAFGAGLTWGATLFRW